MAKNVTVERLGQSAILTINNPPANLWTLDSLRELAAEMAGLEQDSSIRSVVITGEGDAFFSAGADLKQFARGDRQLAADVIDAFAAAFGAVRRFRGVTVAAINGYALGGGLECALACDYMVAEVGAQLGLPETKVGLLPCAGGTKALTDKVGVSWAKRIMLGGEILPAAKALAIGLVEEVVDPGLSKIVAVSLANKAARQAPNAIQEVRRLISGSSYHDMDEHLVLEKQAMLRLIGEEEQLEGVAAFMGKRTPKWCDEE